MTITQESRPGGQTEAARDTRSTHPQDTAPTWLTHWRGDTYLMDEHGRLHLDTEGGYL